ncbi:hypothetical protein EC968_006884 [Mortierella alpina]|nr:hypothetical protein EC968_006884 [Mortierella alpina]
MILARTNTKTAQEVRRAEGGTFKHYWTTKSTLTRVKVVKIDAASSDAEATITTQQEPAISSDKSDGDLKRKASKCRTRSEAMRQKFHSKIKASAAAVFPSLGGLALDQGTAQAKVDHPRSWAGTSSSSCGIPSTAASVNILPTPSIKTSPAAAGNRTSTIRQLASPAPQAVVSISAASELSSSSLFSSDVSPVLHFYRLPCPDETLHTTRQLACCLALLQSSVDEDDLSQDALKWRHSTLNNVREKDRLEALAAQIVEAFAEDIVKSAAAVAEVVELAPVLEKDHFRFLLKAFIDAINGSELLNFHSLEGLAEVIHGAAPGSIDSDDLVTILRSLHKQLRLTHSPNHLHCLSFAVSQVLDAMVDAQVGDVDRESLHRPLTDILQELKGSDDLYLNFQVQYATQALLRVCDNESTWHAVFRRAFVLLKGGVGFAKMPDPRELKDMVEGSEQIFRAFRRFGWMCRDLAEALKSREAPAFTFKNILEFRRLWYDHLRIAELYIQTGKLLQFRELIADAPCRHQLLFQWGISQLLGRFATDTQWDLEARRNAIAFLGELHSGNSIWTPHKQVDQIIIDVLSNVILDDGKNFEVAKKLLEEVKQQNTVPKPSANLQPRPSNSIQSLHTEMHTSSNAALLKAVQNRNLRHAQNLSDHFPQYKIEGIQSALKTYYASDLVIVRVSGQEMDLDTCCVNLAIVEAPAAQREMEKQNIEEQAAVYHRIPSFEKLEHTNTSSPIPLNLLFDKRKLRDGSEDYPKRILVQGRAGIGKTTLCKKIVHAHQTGLWRDHFDAVLWLPLRQLKALKARNLEGLFREKFFAQDLDEEGVALARALVISAKGGRVLFVLDGLDEIVCDTEHEEGFALRALLKALFRQQHVLITSRPSGLDRSLLPPIDIELETIGFNTQNVSDFLEKTLEPEAVHTVKGFIQQTPLIQGLVNIPVQLDVICFSWESLPTNGKATTMTELYQLMVRKLWRKDALRLKKAAGGVELTARQIAQLAPEDIDGLMATESQYLEYLAFSGMRNNHQIEFDEKALLDAFGDLKEYATYKTGLLPPQLLEFMKQTSFLHTADANLDSRHDHSQQAWHFLHLTFQEYFAATWIARHLEVEQHHPTTRMMTLYQAKAFVQEHKYNPQYEIVWSMVAGLLEGEALNSFFRLFQGAPRDLIGGRHQQILASCLHEARARLDPATLVTLDSELTKWLRFEMQICRNADYDICRLGSQSSFPEALLVETLRPVISWSRALVRALGARPALSDSALQLLVEALKNVNEKVRESAASALGNHTTLPDPAVQSLTTALLDDDRSVRRSAASALGKQSTLSKSATQSLSDALSDRSHDVRYSAGVALVNRSTLMESDIQTLIAAALKDDNKSITISASATTSGDHFTSSNTTLHTHAAALKGKESCMRSSTTVSSSKQPTLPEPSIQTLVAELENESGIVRNWAALALRKHSTLPVSAIQPLAVALKDEMECVKYSAASALSRQPTLPDSAIQSLMAALPHGGKDVWQMVSEALSNHCHSLCRLLPSLSKDELICLYKNHLFRYSCGHVVSLTVEQGRLCIYTEKGLVCSQPIGPEKEKDIASAFEAVRHEAGMHAQLI